MDTHFSEVPNDFSYTESSEPHTRRRKAILAKHPEIKKLYGPDILTVYVVTALVFVQIAIAYYIQQANWIVFLAVAYLIGGSINHSFTLIIHEITHNLAFRKPLNNRLFAIFTNLTLGLPSAMAFKHYHADHHRYLGIHKMDPDLPTQFEARFFNTKFKKTIWLFLQPLFYAFRPLIISPKRITKWEIINIVVQIIFDVLIVYFFGYMALVYFVLCSLLGMGLHPMSAHFISEHYIHNKEQETYSYYGPLNWFTFNVGYHNEHHDFPYVPWTRLKKLRQSAPEFYETIYTHSSWLKLLYNFVNQSNFNLYRRMKRLKEQAP